MKRYKKLGALLAVLVIACAATLVLSQYEKKQEQIRSSDAVLLEIPGDTVTALSWEYEGQSGLGFHKDGDGWKYDEDDAFPVSEDKVMEILSHFEAFGVGFVIEHVSDYSQYGLDKPECTLRLATEASSWELKLGDFSQMDQRRYVDIGDGNVYLVNEDPMDYLVSALSGMIRHDDTPGFENVVDIRFTGAETYTIDRLEESGNSYSDADVYFAQRDGVYLPLDKSAVTTYLNTITTLDLRNYVTYNATREELASCGLEEPELSVTVNYTNTDAEAGDDAQLAGTCVISIGSSPEDLEAAREAEEKGEAVPDISRYVRVGDSQILYELDSVDYGILSAASYDDLRHKQVFWGDFEDVTQIDITLEETGHVLVSGLDEDENRIWYLRDENGTVLSDAEATESTAGTADGTDAAEATDTAKAENTLDLTAFQNALEALSASSFTSEPPAGKEEIRLTLHLDNENFPEVEIVLYRYDGTSCLAAVDGETVSLVSRASVMTLVESVQSFVLNG
ncbi:MAG: DUF4340 domain-containing protein [Faecousia sp.]